MKKVLIIRTDHLGDLVLTTPLVRALSVGNYQVIMLVREAYIQILDNNEYIFSYYTIEDLAPEFPKGWLKILKWIRHNNFDIIIIPHSKPKMLLFISFFSGIKRRMLMQGGILGRLTKHVCLRSNLYGNPRHFSELYLDFAKYLELEHNDIRPDLFLYDSEVLWAIRRIKEQFQNGHLVVGIHPGHKRNTCNLGFEDYEKLIKIILKNTDWDIIITGDQSESIIINSWEKSILDSTRIWNSSGQLNLRELSSIIKRMDLLICPGTGPLHIANAVGTRTLSPLCARVGHNETFWGNTNGLGHAINITTEKCKKKKGFCKFEGLVTAEMLVKKAVKLLYS